MDDRRDDRIRDVHIGHDHQDRDSPELMAASVKVVVTGIASIDRRLRSLPTRIQIKVANRAARAAMKLVAKAIRAIAPYLTGTLKSNVVVRAGLKRKRSEVSIDARIDANAETKKTSKNGKTYFYPAIVEYGRKKKGGPKAATKMLSVRELRAGAEHRERSRSAHYMLRAFKSAGEAARKVAIRLLREGVEREANKA
jgi:hypothetical protein